MILQTLLKNIEVCAMSASPDMEITGVSYDSRTTKPGDLFVAVSGFATDGHRFIPMAIERGAAAILCEHDMPEGTPWIQVKSARKTLALLGGNWYGHPSEAMQMIGVTGTNGKTSVTCLVKTLIEETLGGKVGLIGTIRNQIGEEVLETERTTPESFELQGLLAKMRDAGCTHVVMEVSSHALALNRVDGITFTVGAFTNLTEDHLDFHVTMEEYRLAKSRLFSMCKRGVFNLDDEAAQKMIADANCEILTVATEKDADICAKEVELTSDHIEMNALYNGESTKVHIGIPGYFTVSNGLVAMGIAHALEIPMEEAAEALKKAKGVKGRIEVVPTPGKEYTVLIDYAHTPDGLENVLRSVREFCKGRLIVVFGCGGDRDRTKRPIMGRIALEYADFAIVTSDNPRTEAPMAIINDILCGMKDIKKPYVVEEDRRRAIRVALRCGRKHDIIVLAGKGHETYQILGTEKTHLDEREEVASALWEMRK